MLARYENLYVRQSVHPRVPTCGQILGGLNSPCRESYPHLVITSSFDQPHKDHTRSECDTRTQDLLGILRQLRHERAEVLGADL